MKAASEMGSAPGGKILYVSAAVDSDVEGGLVESQTCSKDASGYFIVEDV